MDDPGANLDPWSLHLAPLYVLDRRMMSGLFTEVLAVNYLANYRFPV